MSFFTNIDLYRVVLFVMLGLVLGLVVWRTFWGQPGTGSSGMTFLEFLDRTGQRRAQRIYRPWDIRQFIGFMFLGGYYVMVYQFTRGQLPPENVALIRDAMLTLGPPVGLIVGAMFRSDAAQDQSARNTGEGFKAIQEVAKNSGTGAGGEKGAAAVGAEQATAAAEAEAERLRREAAGKPPTEGDVT